jgi:plasmid stabilization system protein ParE
MRRWAGGSLHGQGEGEIGYVYRKHEALPIRILLYGHYRIAYLIKSADEIDVLGVFHGALDIDRYLT